MKKIFALLCLVFAVSAVSAQQLPDVKVENAQGKIISVRDLVQGKPNPYTDVFSPSRTILRPQLAVNAFESVVGLLTPTAPRCPHLGCALKYNRAEHSWDCPCHGSRFTEQGELINNPATDDKRL